MPKSLKAIRLFLSLFSCFILLTSFSFAQEATKTQVMNIKQIDIQGNKTISLSVLLSKIKSKPSSEYSDKVVREDIKRLYETGYFEDIGVAFDEPTGKLTFKVVEKPIIRSIEFQGVKRLAKKSLENALKSKQGDYLDRQKLRQDLREIEKMYERKGFTNVKADFNVETDKDNKARINIKIDEGKSLRVKKVGFKGNETFKDAKLFGLIKSKSSAWWLFRKGYLDEASLKEDVERLKAYYRHEGFIDVDADYAVEELRPGWVKIVFSIREGKRYYVNEVTFTGNDVASRQELLESLKYLNPNEVYAQDRLQADEFNVRSLYMDRGYIYAKVSGSSSVNQQTGKVDVRFDIVEGPVVYVNLIKIKGNVKTKDTVVRRELRLKPGDRFDGSKLRRSRERLINLGFFDELEGIDFNIEPTDEMDKSNLVVEVKEAHTGSFSFGGGYSTIDEFIGFIELEQRNFDWKNFPYFTGDGQDLRLRASIGSLTESFSLSFTEPWLFDYPVSFGFDAFSFKRDRETDVGFGYNEQRNGGALRLGKEFGEYWRADTFYRYEQIDISEISADATADFRAEQGENSLSTVGVGTTYDTRDNVFDTSKGLRIQNRIELTGGPLGADKDFTKFWHSTSYYMPLFRESVLMAGLRAGLANPFADSDTVPIYSRFFAGGAETIRGYNERKVGPIDPITEDPIGGESLLVFNLEYLYPVFNQVKAAAFLDTGNVWSKVDDFGSGDFKTGVGVGLRIKTPLGPFKLDYGYPLDLEPGEDTKEGQIHFSFSRGF